MLTGTTMLAGRGDLRARLQGKSKRPLDLVEVPSRLRLVVAPSRPEEIQPLVELAERATGVELAAPAVVTRVSEFNRESLWTFRRHGRIVGGIALLLLNGQGLSALLTNTLDLSDPPSQLLVPPNTAPAAIYAWALLGPSLAAEGIVRVIRRLREPPYHRADFYTIPVTRDGFRFMIDFGFEPVSGHVRSLFRYARLANRTSGRSDA
jgi:hypothetical protein